MITFMNSARKNRANRIDEYSVLKPPTSSCSASTRSNGGRLSSAVMAIRNTTNGMKPVDTMCQSVMPSWTSTIARGRQRARHQQHGGEAQPERRLVRDHLRRCPHRAEQRVLRARRPAGEHDPVDADRAQRQHEQDAHRRVERAGPRVMTPNHSTVPSLSPLKSPPSGITDHSRKAGTKARNGASRNTHLSALSGSRSSLKNSFVPSASVCSRPHGPALFGPDPVLHARHDLALEPDHEHRADRARSRRSPAPWRRRSRAPSTTSRRCRASGRLASQTRPRACIRCRSILHVGHRRRRRRRDR